jgi:hypothetical protein
MTEVLRKIDARTGTDADGNNYYVVFCARDSDNSSAKPGHAFVVWGIEDNTAAISSQQAFGFYPDASDESKAAFGTVSGQLVDEATKNTPSSLLTARLIVQVNKDPFETSQVEITTWQTSDYNLFSKNCISFARAVAVAIGLFPPPVATVELPTTYLDDLIENASQT